MPSKLPPRKDKNRVPRQKREITPAHKEAERVAKVIARAGLGSRREIEEWIGEGRVAVNGIVLETPAVTVTASDRIEVDGAPLPEKERTRLFLYHKPRGVVTTNRDPEGRTTLFEILPRGLPRLVSVGRLDLNSEGLLLLTNDGGLARVLELPETAWLRRYRVRAKGEIDQGKLDALIKGVTVEGISYGPIEATLDRVQGANAWLTVSLREGKNREVRNVLAALGMAVNRLIRVSYGPFQLGDVPEGGIEELSTRILRDQIGDELATAAGADFDGPLIKREVEDAPYRTTPAAEPARPAKRGAARPRRTDAPRDFEPEEAVPAHRRGRSDPNEREVESRGTVADRKGREIKVERVVASRVEDGRAARKSPGGARRGSRDGGPDEAHPARGRPFREEGDRPARRPARREEGDRSEARPARARTGTGDRAPRPYREDGDRPARRPTRHAEGDVGDARPARARTGTGERAPRPYREDGDRPRRPARREDGDRAEARPARGRFGDGDRAPRPYREDGDRPRRPARREEGDRGDARPARGRFGEGDRAPRPYREDGDRPRRPARREDGDRGEARPARTGTGDRAPRPYREDGERPRRSESRADRPVREDFRKGGDGSRRSAGKSFADRSEAPRRPRHEGDATSRRSGDFDGPRGGKGRSAHGGDDVGFFGGDAPRAGAKPRAGGPKRGAGPGAGRSFSKDGPRPPRSGGPGGKRTGGDRPGGKPGGRPGGKPGGRPPRSRD